MEDKKWYETGVWGENMEVTTKQEKKEIAKMEKKELKQEMKKTHGGKIGFLLGGAAGAIGTVMANPLGRWMIFTAQDEAGCGYRLRGGYRFALEGTNTIMAYPAILPIAGGVLAAGVGALVGRKISKSKLKHKNMKKAETNTMKM